MKAKRKKAAPVMPARRNLELQTAIVDNPQFSRSHAEGRHGNVAKITAIVNVRESAIATLAARGVINSSQVAAADRFRSLWEQMGGAGAGAFDYSREPVDGGGAREPISERQVMAGKELARCRALLGLRGYTLVSRVCGEGQSLWDIGSKRRDRDTAADMLRGMLDDLAGMWGLASRRAS